MIFSQSQTVQNKNANGKIRRMESSRVGAIQSGFSQPLIDEFNRIRIVNASHWLCEALDAAGFRVGKGAAGMPTAFIARAGNGPLNIGICAEYDCLPGIGHACGHNLIAAMSAGAGIASFKVADENRQ